MSPKPSLLIGLLPCLDSRLDLGSETRKHLDGLLPIHARICHRNAPLQLGLVLRDVLRDNRVWFWSSGRTSMSARFTTKLECKVAYVVTELHSFLGPECSPPIEGSPKRML